MAAPMPRLPPVTSATFPDSSFMSFSFLWSAGMSGHEDQRGTGKESGPGGAPARGAPAGAPGGSAPAWGRRRFLSARRRVHISDGGHGGPGTGEVEDGTAGRYRDGPR